MSDKCVIVTGAGSGIGRATALRFAADGAMVMVSDIQETAARSVSNEILAMGGQATPVETDVADGKSVQNLIEIAAASSGRIDVIVSSAGIWRPSTIAETKEEDWDQVFAVNTKSLFWLAKYGHFHLRNSAGTIIAVSSVTAFKGSRNFGAYNASKAALIATVRNLALEFAGDGIRVNCVCPGFVETPLAAQVIVNRGGEGAREAVLRAHPLGLGQPDDVAGPIHFLASDDARWITGVAMMVDGGSSV